MKTKVIYIYGAPAVGKLTTAKALSDITGFKVFHNHLASDLVRSVFERGSAKGDMLIVKLRFEILELAVKEQVSGVIMTGAHAHNFIYPNGENDEWYASHIEKITTENDGEFYGVNLVTSADTLMERVLQTDRLEWKKIHSREVLQEVLEKNDYAKTAPLKNNHIIDNTDMSVEEVTKQIIEFIKFNAD